MTTVIGATRGNYAMTRYGNAGRYSGGFTLIELGVVMVVIAMLLGGALQVLSVQVEASRVREARQQLAEIKEALLGFALANGRLPCPATPTSDGAESPVYDASYPEKHCARDDGADGNWGTADDTLFQHGFVPAATLALAGSRNGDQLLVDPWGNPVRYSVSNANHATLGDLQDWDFVTEDELRNVGLENLFPDLNVCNTSTGATTTRCQNAASTVTGNYVGASPNEPGAIFVVYSLAADGATYQTFATVPPDEDENAGEGGAQLGGGPTGLTYPVAGDTVFVSRTFSQDPGNEFDDILDWVSPNILYSRLIAAGRLP